MEKYRIKASVIYLLVVIALTFSTSTQAQNLGAGKSQKQVLVDTLALPNQPVIFDFATVTNIEGKDTLTFSSLNKSMSETTSVEIVVFTVDVKGKITGGQGFVQNTRLLPNEKFSESLTLKNALSPGDRLVLTVWGVDTSTNKIFNVESTELLKLVELKATGSLNSYLKSQNPNTIKVRYTTPIQETYCSRALRMAQGACSCGVASFSCNDTGQNFSFTCKAQSECPEGPPET